MYLFEFVYETIIEMNESTKFKIHGIPYRSDRYLYTKSLSNSATKPLYLLIGCNRARADIYSRDIISTNFDDMKALDFLCDTE